MCLPPEVALEPWGLVRVVTGAPACAEAEGVEACDALVRVVTGAPAGAELDGEPVDACDGLVRVVTAVPPAETAAPGDPAPCEPLAAVWIERAELTRPGPPRPRAPPCPAARGATCSWRTMWIVRRITCVATAGAGLRAESDTDELGCDRNEKPARPAASSAARAPAIRVCVLRIFRGPPLVGWGRTLLRPRHGPDKARQRFGKAGRGLALTWRSLYSLRPSSLP